MELLRKNVTDLRFSRKFFQKIFLAYFLHFLLADPGNCLRVARVERQGQTESDPDKQENSVFYQLNRYNGSGFEWEIGEEWREGLEHYANNITHGCTTHCTVTSDKNLDCWLGTLSYFEKILLGTMRRYTTVQVNKVMWYHNRKITTDFDAMKNESVRRISHLPRPFLKDANRRIHSGHTIQHIVNSLVDNAKAFAQDTILHFDDPPKNLHCPRACEKHWDPFLWLFCGSCVVTLGLGSAIFWMVIILERRERLASVSETNEFENTKVELFNNPLSETIREEPRENVERYKSRSDKSVRHSKDPGTGASIVVIADVEDRPEDAQGPQEKNLGWCDLHQVFREPGSPSGHRVASQVIFELLNDKVDMSRSRTDKSVNHSKDPGTGASIVVIADVEDQQEDHPEDAQSSPQDTIRKEEKSYKLSGKRFFQCHFYFPGTQNFAPGKRVRGMHPFSAALRSVLIAFVISIPSFRILPVFLDMPTQVSQMKHQKVRIILRKSHRLDRISLTFTQSVSAICPMRPHLRLF
ncbi:hypothetical protein Ddc_11564 [Ditylenchus destructor]|nr:hypothetical protein Ddc_11564 [Ditylenchus destructor]